MSKIKLNYTKWGLTSNKSIVPIYGLSDIVGSFTVESDKQELYLQTYDVDKNINIDKQLETYLKAEFAATANRSNKIIGLITNNPILSLDSICKALSINYSTIMIKGVRNLDKLFTHTFLEKRVIVVLDEYTHEQLEVLKTIRNIICVVQTNEDSKFFTSKWTNIVPEQPTLTTRPDILLPQAKKKVTKFFTNGDGVLSGMVTEEVDDTIVVKENK